MAYDEEEYIDYMGEDTGVYDEKGREELLEGDEISPEEEGFMEGYENQDVARCAFCHAVLVDTKVIERKINGKTYRFCSESCAEEFEKEQEM